QRHHPQAQRMRENRRSGAAHRHVRGHTGAPAGMTPEALLGLTEDHLVALAEPGHRLQPEAAAAFAALQAAAVGAGFTLTPASSFRGFDRQLAIWNGKFEGSRPLLDAASRPLDALALPEPE